MNSLSNFRYSMVIPGFEKSESIFLKSDGDEDIQIAADIKARNNQTRFRFICEKTMLLNLQSQFQNSFNVCVHVAFVHGQY